jgi:hypothetical protein
VGQSLFEGLIVPKVVKKFPSFYGTRSFITYLLAPWSRVLLEKLTGLHLVKKFPAFYYNNTENTYCDCNGKISSLLNNCLQESLLFDFVMIWIIRFWILKMTVLSGEFLQKIIEMLLSNVHMNNK